MAIKGGRGHDENGGIDQKREVERQEAVNEIEPHRGPQAFGRPFDGAGLDNGGMEIEIVRHNRGAENTDGDEEHLRVGHNFEPGDEAAHDSAEARPDENDFNQITGPDDADQCDDDDFEKAEAPMLQVKDGQNVERRQAHSPGEGKPEKQVEGDGGADDLRQVASGNRDFAEDPKPYRCAPRIVGSARLGEVPLRHNAEPHGERLQEQRHQVRQHQDGDQTVGEARASRNVRRPVARVHVANRHDESRSRKYQQFSPETGADGNPDGAMHLRQ